VEIDREFFGGGREYVSGEGGGTTLARLQIGMMIAEIADHPSFGNNHSTS
jgi:hypothetical protein